MRIHLLTIALAIFFVGHLAAQNIFSPIQTSTVLGHTPNQAAIGIGTWPCCNPEARLHIAEELVAHPTSLNYINGSLFRTDGNSTIDSKWQFYTGYSASNPGSTQTEKFRMTVPANTSNMVFNMIQTNGSMNFQTGGATRLYLQESTGGGNVGIGTTSPQYKLDVSGDIRSTSKVIVNGRITLDGFASTVANTAWAGTGNRVMITNSSGVINPLTAGTSNQVLYGNGVWGGLPSVLSQMSSSGADVYLPSSSARLGVGTSNPQSALDVVGNANVSGVLKLAGLAGSSSAPLFIDNTGAVFKGVPSGGCVVGSPQWSWGGDNFAPFSIVGGSVNYAEIGTCNSYDFILKSNNNDRQWIQTDGSISFGSQKVTSNTGGPEFHFSGGAIRLRQTNTYGGPQIIFDGGTSPYGDWGIEYTGYTGTTVNRGLNFWKPFGSPNSNNALLFLADNGNIGVNTDAPTSRFMVDSWSGDAITSITSNNTSKQLRVQYKDLSNNNTITDNFLVNGNGTTWIGKSVSSVGASQLVVGQPSQTDKFISLVDNSNTAAIKDVFNVYGSGYTEIKVYSPNAMPSNRVFAIKEAVTNKDICVIKADGKLYAREIEVSLMANFPDYVFDKAYNMKTIREVATYIELNKRLPGFEKAEYYEKNGMNVNQILVKQQEKIEELTLYIIEMEKRLSNLEDKNKN